jgi:hypothetical protein
VAGAIPNAGPVLRLALSYYTWRTLGHESGLTQGAAVAAMVEAVDGAVVSHIRRT